MRPTVRLAIAAGVLAAAAGGWLIYQDHADADQPPAKSAGEAGGRTPAGQQAAVPVLVTKAAAKDVPITSRGLGTVQAFNTVTVRSRVDGYITRVAFEEGQDVKRGDLLVQIDPRPFQAALEQAQANLARDQAQLVNARLDLQRYQALARQEFATRQRVDTQVAQVAQLEATAKADQAAIASAKLNLDYASIRSPIDGRTGPRLVDVGNLITANSATSLLVVTQIHPIFVTFTLPEQDLTKIRNADSKGDVPVVAFDGNDQHQLSTGKLSLISNQIDPTTGNVTLKALFGNAHAELWPGQFVNAHLQYEIVRNGVVIPLSALGTGPKGRFVYVLKPDQTVDLRSVSVRQIQNNEALLDKGVRAGEIVVTAGQFRLAPGAKVSVKQPSDPSAPQPTVDSPARVASGSSGASAPAGQ